VVLFLLTGRFFSFSLFIEPVEVKFGMANRTLGKPKQVARQKNLLTEHTRAFSGAISLLVIEFKWSQIFFRLKYLIAIKIFNRD